MRYFRIILFFLPLIFISFHNHAQISIGNTVVDTNSIATNLDTPWEILWGPDDHIWITERYGRVSRLNPESGELTGLITINEVYEESESGLLGMALHPDFPDTPYVYLVYNYLSGNAIQEKLVRYTYESSRLVAPQTLIDGIDGNSNHNGSRIVFDEENMLYFTTGDAGNTAYSQDLNSLNGKILRMNPDGTIPTDNPYENSYIWTYGHRNPQGLVISPDGIMYSSEHGPASDDEMNIIEKGKNYGWPDVMGYCDEASETSFCSEHQVKEPIAAWTPTLAVAGTDHYHHDAIPEWNNSLLMTTLKESELVQLKLSEDGMSVLEEKRWFDGWFGRLRDLCISPGGSVFLAVSNRDGRGNPRPGDDRIVEIKTTTGTNTQHSLDDKEKITVYPNPPHNESHVTVTIPNNYTGGKLNIFDVRGVKVYQRNISHSTLTIATEQLEDGIYVIEATKDDLKVHTRFIIE
jgi:glucose/arabinose dehydrogenase